MKHPNDHYYILRFQYLGFRYHGWQKQPQVKTLQGMTERTINYVLEGRPFKILSAGRTDAMVSAQDAAVQLITREQLDRNNFLKDINNNLPADIKLMDIEPMPDDLNIIQDVGTKVYHYLFAQGVKFNPYCAPFMALIHESLDIPKMIDAAPVFKGTHNFGCFCEPSDKVIDFNRTITNCVLTENTEVKASFFPKESYVLEIVGSGFMRYQVRYIMGALLAVGRGELTVKQIEQALESGGKEPLASKAPASGLVLTQVNF